MIKRKIQTAVQIFFLAIAAGSLTGCKLFGSRSVHKIIEVKSYRDISGITREEIAAVESLKKKYEYFSYAVLYSTEAFVQENGLNNGFSTIFCGLLSELFDIPFVQEFYSPESMKEKFNSGEIDFSGEYSATPENAVLYSMSLPIAERTLSVFTHKDSRKIQTVSELNGKKLGFFEGNTAAQSIRNSYPLLRFGAVYLKNDVASAVQMLETGGIDVFVINAVESYRFAMQPVTISRDVFTNVYTPVSLATAKSELEPVISVMNKYIEGGGFEKINELYNIGNNEYSKYEFSTSLSSSERIYLNKLIISGQKIPVGFEGDNYPISFYNEVEDKFQGIAPEILDEIRKLSGIMFYEVNTKNAPWTTLYDMLKNGDISMVTELLYTNERRNDFLWSEPYAKVRYALLSKSDYPHIKMYQVARSNVGVVMSSGFENIYNTWFPGNSNLKYYSYMLDSIKALESGEIDLLMASDNVLLAMMNYREKTGYKINVYFNLANEETSFGFNRNEEILCSIIRKAQSYIDCATIEQNWKSRIFDYSRKIANERLVYLSASATVLLIVLVILVFLFLKNRQTGERYRNQMITLSTIYNTIPDLVYCMDTDCRFTNCNRSYEDFTGLKEPEIIGKTDLEIYARVKDREIPNGYMDTNFKVIEEKRAISLEEVVYRHDNTSFLFKTTKTPLIQDNKIVGLLGIGRDITDYRAAERAAQEASRSKSNFLAKMSHEIRTPMNAIIGMAELALRENEITAAHKHVLTVKQAGVHLLSIINDILDFSKIEMGKLEIIYGDYSFSSLINDVISIIRMRVIDSQVRFAVNIDSKIPDALNGDETRIRQILLNILNNAVKYTEKGFVTFTVTLTEMNDDNITLVMEVMDSGKGIKKEDIDKLFGEYIQIDADKNRGIEGVGLGLAITWNIVKAMNGEIHAYSEYGVGSTFTVTLPQKVRSHAVLACVDNPEDKKVLVYERRELYANSITTTIDNLGVKCLLVSNDLEFRRELENTEYSFIFISFKLLENNNTVIAKLAEKTKIVVLSEFGEAIPDKKLRVLAMPVYSTTIANVLNGISDSFSYNENHENIVRFVAPSAKVLIVDDINTNLKVAEGLMLPYRMQLELCNSGKDAIEVLKSRDFDLVFMDHKMPEMDGVETTQLIRLMGNEDVYYKNLPIIILTANAVSGAKEMFMSSGFNDFLSKPIDTLKLKAILEKWIPKAKQKISLKNEGTTPVQENSKPDNEIDISGLDTKKGIFLSGGQTGAFFETLAIFYKDGQKKADELRTCLEAGDLSLYTINVHALKSASANIGADKLSNQAKELEIAGEREDINFIETHNDQLLENLESLLKNINEAVQKRNKGKDTDNDSFNHELFNNLLTVLKDALNNLDAGTINKTAEELIKCNSPDKFSSIVGAIYDKILVCEYDEAVSLIDEIRRNSDDGENS